MKDEEKKQFANALIHVAELYDKKLSRQLLDVYWHALREELDSPTFRKALSRHVRDPQAGQFMPKPADILRNSGNRKDPILIWGEVVEAMGTFGAYETVCFADPVVNAVIHDMGGWPWVCHQNLEEPWTQKEFERRYASYSQHSVGKLEPLIGLHQDTNLRNSYQLEAQNLESKHRLLGNQVRMIGGERHGELLPGVQVAQLMGGKAEELDQSPQVIKKLMEGVKQ